MVLPEAAFQRQVTDFAALNGWTWWHDNDSVRNHPGFPDLVLVRDRSLVFAELKTETGRLSGEQRAWIALLGMVETGVAELAATLAIVAPDVHVERPAVEVRVWRPSDWDEIAARLSRPRVAVPT